MKNKNIVLCSDGTGNKGGYGEDTNVYKTYKAVKVFDEDQYTFYDQGVGTDKSETSKNKYWTALSGAFGFGFRDNVLNLYHFLARCYEPGDAIFLFGFSRGAATVRAFAGFIGACGLIDKNHPSVQINGVLDDRLFKEKVNEAFKCYMENMPSKNNKERKENSPRAQQFKKDHAVKHDVYAPDGNLKIKFIGVWDTVSALGFPVEDFSIILRIFGLAAKKIAEMVPNWKHEFYDYELNDSIENAYHAIAIDDERKTFHPKVWDENQYKGHVEQVWFAGVHSNVGGGYPRTGLSDVALRWMLYKAQSHGLKLHPDHITAIESSMNIYDKLYDSRDGVAIYYCYGPRNLKELCESKLKGMIAIHVTAYNKMKEESDSYTPDGMPPAFDVVDIDTNNPTCPTVSKRQIDVLKNHPSEWKSLEDKMKNLIGIRKKLYIAFAELTMAIILVSWCLWVYPPQSVTDLNICEITRVQIKESELKVDKENSRSAFSIDNYFSAYQQNRDISSSNDLPEFCRKASNRPLKGLADIMRYLTPVFFENFITYVVEVHVWIFIAMLTTLYLLNKSRKYYIDELDRVCNKLNKLF